MTDHYGIGAAMEGIARIYFQSARHSGRTMSLVESLKDGDRVVFTSAREADRVKILCAKRGVTVTALVIDPQQPHRVFDRPQSEGRTLFDHSWVEDFYLAAIKEAARRIEHMQRESSGFGEAHRETRRKAMEIDKWRQ